MEGSKIPKVNWTIDATNGDITVQADTKPKAVHLWHATTFWHNRRDFRIANLDNPCLCGPGGLSIGGYNNLCGNLFVLWTAEVKFSRIKVHPIFSQLIRINEAIQTCIGESGLS